MGDRIYWMTFSSIRQDNDKPHTTLILYGPPGCGMCKLSEQVQTAVGQDRDVRIAGDIPAQLCPSQPVEGQFTNLFSISFATASTPDQPGLQWFTPDPQQAPPQLLEP